ncbi:probable disease resistance protein At4g27220 [Argentina anserina]|uniref:probable disease resistance protein At4g27220 n=1 Tax=Argentina anserina TaxID=57926 RepID=UPI00217679CD|nr:probable disease resistance protein At4g27220 [Potentilla anserina]XP_050381610.1 probable disease resistance protein At4g27220 [Potentilla anserina]
MASSTKQASAAQPALASVELTSQWKHDVFLSFRGDDTRKGIVSYLYHELQRRGIKTFKDEPGLQIGTDISPSLLKAIEESRSAIVVLSPDYATSTWCLDELEKIIQCSEAKNTRVLPIFYNVDPSDVRNQRGSFAEAFTKHEEKVMECGDNTEKLKQWRAALTKVANVSGFDSNKYGSDRELVQCIVELVCSNLRPISRMSSGYFEAFEATRRAIDELMEALKNDEVTSIGVYGMGGVGKTSMVKHVGAIAQENDIFHHVIMIVISQIPDMRKIQGTLADLLGLKLEEETEMGRAARLMEKIMKVNKILIILDDIWDTIDMSSIGIPSYDELKRCNSKVLLTTRRVNVCHTMESQANIHLSCLSEEDSWKLFVHKARKSFDKSTNFYDIARKVARKCAGLPVALIAVARALGDKDFRDWKEAARQLEVSECANLDQKDVFSCIKLSYDYLDGNDAKSCLLLCCLFPEGHEIQIEDLMKYGFGVGLFRDVNSTIEDARVRANSSTNYLKASGLLLDGTRDGCIRVHNVIRNMTLSIAMSVDGHASLVKTHCHLKEWPVDTHDDYSAISLIGSNICKLPKKLVCSKLQILLLQRNSDIRKIPKTFFQSPNDIRVLDLSETTISSLPLSFSLLTRLQSLHLDYCKHITDISVLGKLKKLETFSMRGCYIKKFPKEMGNLSNLRMLDLTKTNVQIVPAQVISRLHRLEELYMKCSFGNWGSKFEEGLPLFRGKKADFDELTSSSRLNILEVPISSVECLPQDVKFHPNWVSFDICIGIGRSIGSSSDAVRYSRSLTLNTTMNSLPDWFINVVAEKAEDLYYSHFHGLINLLEEHDRGRLHGLKYLSLDSLGAKVLLNTISNPRVSNEPVFENLEGMYVSSLHFLEELCVGELPAGSLRNIKAVNVQSCSQLVKPLLQSNLLHMLQNLKKLVCHKMHAMEYVFGFKGQEPQHFLLTKLRVISLRHVANMKNIWNGPAPPGIFQSLKRFFLNDCLTLKYLFTSDVARCLFQLEDLWVESCHRLDRIVTASEETDSNKIVLPQLKNLILLCLPELTRLSSAASDNTVIKIECPCLEHLYVSVCPQFPLSASEFHSNNQVQLNDHQHIQSLKERWN